MIRTLARKLFHFRMAAFFFALSILSLLFVVAFIQREHAVYYWDYIGYNYLSNEFSTLLQTSPLKFFTSIFGTIRSDEYNATPIAVPVLISTALGGGRLGYVLSLVLTYHIPLYFLVFLVSWKIFGNNARVSTLLGASMLVLLFFAPHPWLQTLRGFPDICTLVALTIAVRIALCVHVEEKTHVSTMIALGAALYACFLLRRWCGFAMATFYVVYFSVPFFFLKRVGIRKGFATMTKNAAISAGTTLALALVFQHRYIIKFLREDYGYGYSAYWTAMGWRGYLFGHYEAIGPLLLALIALAPVVWLLERAYTRELLFLFLCFAAYPFFIILYSGTGPQHKLPFVLFALFLGLYTLIGLDRLTAAKPRLKQAVLYSTIFLSLFLFGASALPGITANPGVNRILLTNRLRPLRHPGYKDLQRLYKDLDSLVRDTPNRVAILSSDFALNDSLLQFNAGEAVGKAIVRIPNVDKRDALELKLFEADYVVVADPIQYHLRPENQYAIGVPARLILDGEGIGAAYEPIGGEYDLGLGVVGRMYRKQRAPTLAELQDFLGKFPEERKNWPIQVTRTDLFFATMDFTLGDVRGVVEYKRNGRLIMRPGETSPTIVTFRDHGVATCTVEVSVPPSGRSRSSRTSPGEEEMRIAFSVDGQEREFRVMKTGEKHAFVLDLRGSAEFSITVSGLEFSINSYADMGFSLGFE